MSMDIYVTGVAHIHGGQRYVLGLHDHYSKVDRVYLLHRKSDALQAILQLFVAWCASLGVVVRRLHSDNAGELTGKQVGLM